MIQGYVADVPYVRSFTRELAPAWLDHVALVSGFASPQRTSGFTYCDLGCGHGFTSAVLAVTHPNGVFHAIDANPDHIQSADTFAADCGIANATYHAADFSRAASLNLPAFDYIVSHGVYSWVNDDVRQSWRSFIERHLKPGGVLYVSYNAMPGRAADVPLQRLVHAFGRTIAGDSQERTMSAVQTVISLIGMKVPALVASPLAMRLKESMDKLPPGYLTHELMGAHWDPVCVTDVRAALAPGGFMPAGSATLLENYDTFVLGRAARAVLATINDPDVRELVRDFFIDQFFRRDVFVRDGRRLTDEERRSRLLESVWSLARPAALIDYQLKTPAGKLSFDNRASRRIVEALAAGPRRLAHLADGSIPAKDLIANALALSSADAIWPVESNPASVAALNQAIFSRVGSPREIRYVALPFGTAVTASRELLNCLKNGEPRPEDAMGAWIASQLIEFRPLS